MFYHKLKVSLAGCVLSIFCGLANGQDGPRQYRLSTAWQPASTGQYDELSLLDVVKISLENNNQLKITEIFADISKEGIQVQEGQFDSQIQGSGTLSAAENPSPFEFDIVGVDNSSSSFGAGLQKRLKSSPVVNVTVSSDSTGDEFRGQNFNEAANTVLGLSVTFPLWKGRGTYLTTLPLELARLNFDASTLDLKQQIDINIFQTVTSYWNYRGAVETLKLLRDSEVRSTRLLRDIQSLIDADELPNSEFNVVKAQLSQRRGSRLRGEQNVIDTKAVLASSLGIVLSKSTEENTPTTNLAEPGIDRKLIELLEPEALLQNVMEIRNDFSALDVRIDIANKQIELAEDDTKPTLNLVVGGSYKAFKQDDSPLSSLDAPTFGPDWSVRLDYLHSLNQTSAKANKRIAELGLIQRQIEKSELQRSTAVDLGSALFAFIQSDRRYSEAKERFELSIQNLSSERKKLLLDSATILDVLNIEDQLLQAELDIIQERVNYGSILARLMFVSGRMGGVANDTIVLEDLRSGEGFINALMGNL